MPSIVFVPGTQATELVDSEGRVEYSASGLTILSKLGPLRAARVGRHTPEEWGELMSLRYEAGSLEPVSESVKLFPGNVLQTPYEPLYREYGSELEGFPYDWRFDILGNGKDLVQRLRSTTSSADDGKWRLVGHSQGGLVIAAAGALAGPEEFSRLVSHVALVAAPLAGTMRAAEALLWGRDDLGDEEDLIAMLRSAARTWPALFQMLPAWKSILDRHGNPAPAKLQLDSPNGWPAKYPLEEEDIQNLARAEAFHEVIKGWLENPGSYHLKVIMGMEQDTTNAIKRNGSLPDSLEGQPTERGDSLVPAIRTITWADGRLNGPTELVRPNLAHAMMLKDPEVLDMVKTFFAQPAQ